MPSVGLFAHTPTRKALILAAMPAMGWMAYWPVRLAWADHLSRAADPSTIGRAVRLSPDDADFRLKLAAARQAAGADARAELSAAVELDPGNAEAWMRLGLAREMGGDPHGAERAFLQAARVSRQFAPRWALANYYFRREDAERFWPWAKESLTMGYGDLSPLFRLCWNKSQDGGLIFARAIPDRRAVLNRYVWYLMREGRLAASAPAAARLAAEATEEDRATLIAWCNGQIDAGSATAALQVWNAMCARHLLPYAPLNPGLAPLTDGSFAAVQVNGGFAWRMPAVAGIASGVNVTPRYLWVAFRGDQPEACVPLLQFAPVAAGARYCLRIEYRTVDLPAASGLRWSALDARTGADLTAASPSLSSADWTRVEAPFTAPQSALVNLSLICRRVAGATRIAGSLQMRRVWLERLP